MSRFLVTIYRPNGYDPATSEDERVKRDIDILNEEMVAAGVRIFVGGLHPPGEAKSVQLRSNGVTLVQDGPHIDTAEHIGGLWVLEAVDLDKALEWGRKAALACRAQVEVRRFH